MFDLYLFDNRPLAHFSGLPLMSSVALLAVPNADRFTASLSVILFHLSGTDGSYLDL